MTTPYRPPQRGRRDAYDALVEELFAPSASRAVPTIAKPSAPDPYDALVDSLFASPAPSARGIITHGPITAAPDEPRPGLGTEAGRGVQRGLAAIPGSVGSTLGTIGRVLERNPIVDLLSSDRLPAALDARTIPRGLQAGGAWLEDWGKDLGTDIPQPTVPSTGDIRTGAGVRPFAEDLSYFLAAQAGQGVASSAPSLVSGGLGSLARLGPAAQAASMFVPSYLQNTGDVAEEVGQVAPAMPQSDRDALALTLGVPVALLDMVTEGAIVDRATKAMAGGAARRTVGQAIKEGGKATLGSMASEAGTEALQDATTYAGTRLAAGKELEAGELGRRVLDAALGGAVAGGVMGGGGAALETAGVAYKNRQADRAQAKTAQVLADLEQLLAEREQMAQAIQPQPPQAPTPPKAPEPPAPTPEPAKEPEKETPPPEVKAPAPAPEPERAIPPLEAPAVAPPKTNETLPQSPPAEPAPLDVPPVAGATEPEATTTTAPNETRPAPAWLAPDAKPVDMARGLAAHLARINMGERGDGTLDGDYSYEVWKDRAVVTAPDGTTREFKGKSWEGMRRAAQMVRTPSTQEAPAEAPAPGPVEETAQPAPATASRVNESQPTEPTWDGKSSRTRAYRLPNGKLLEYRNTAKGWEPFVDDQPAAYGIFPNGAEAEKRAWSVARDEWGAGEKTTVETFAQPDGRKTFTLYQTAPNGPYQGGSWGVSVEQAGVGGTSGQRFHTEAEARSVFNRWTGKPPIPSPAPAANDERRSWKGDEAKWTGNTKQIGGATFYELEITEGRLTGESRWTNEPPPSLQSAPAQTTAQPAPLSNDPTRADRTGSWRIEQMYHKRDYHRAVSSGDEKAKQAALDEIERTAREEQTIYAVENGAPNWNPAIRELLERERPGRAAAIDAEIRSEIASERDEQEEQQAQESPNDSTSIEVQDGAPVPTPRPPRTVPGDGSGGGVRAGVGGLAVSPEPDAVPAPGAVGAPASADPGEGTRGAVDAARDTGVAERPASTSGEPDAGPVGDATVSPSPRNGDGATPRGVDDTGTRPERGGDADPVAAPGDRIEAHAKEEADAHASGSDFRYTPEVLAKLEQGGPVEKWYRNLEAVKLAKQIAAEGRPATAAEQQVIALFAGWGPVRNLFDERDASAARRRHVDAMRVVLTPEEFRAAESASKNSHYTAPVVIQAMWRLVQRLGVRGGRFLEPSVGSGSFIGLMPGALRGKSRWVASELDHVTAQITKALYPTQAVVQMGFQDVVIPDGSMDVAISNVPFGDYGIVEKLAKHVPDFAAKYIHNYFFARALQLVRPGGIVAFITSDGTMDAPKHQRTREYLAEHADLLGAIRLPGGAFQQVAGTKVTTDIIVLQRRPAGQQASGAAWAQVVPWNNHNGAFAINEYFVQHPDRMLGDMTQGGLYGRGDQKLEARPGEDLAAALTEAVDGFPEDVYTAAAARPVEPTVQVPLDEAGRRMLGWYVAEPDGSLKVRTEEGLAPTKIPKAQVPRVKRYIAVRDAREAAMQAQATNAPDADIARTLAALESAYRAFVDAHGPINLEVRSPVAPKKTPTAPRLDEESGADEETGEEPQRYRATFPNLANLDAAWQLVASLEQFDYDEYTTGDKAKAVKPSPLMRQRTLFPRTTRDTRTSDPGEALAAVMAERGRVNLEDVARVMNLATEDEAFAALGDLVFRDPSSGVAEARDDYLAGDVKTKLAIAVQAAKVDPALARNVEALRSVLPGDVPVTDIRARPGQWWIADETYLAFLKEVLFPNVASYLWNDAARIVRVPQTGTMSLHFERKFSSDPNDVVWGFPDARWTGADIFQALLEGSAMKVYAKGPDGKSYLHLEHTETLNDKAKELRAKFEEWLWSDATRAAELAARYNDVMNRYVPPQSHGEHLVIPGTASALPNGRAFTWLPHQKNAVWRFLSRGNVALYHTVGTGKTFTGAAIAMEARRLGLARKPLITMPNPLTAQWAREFSALFPAARLLVATEGDLDGPEARQAFMARAQAGDYDAVLAPTSMLRLMPVSIARQEAYIQAQLAELREAIEEAKKAEGKRGPTVNDLERALAKLDARLQRLIDSKKTAKDRLLTFEDVGFDLLISDESHIYKNQPKVSRRADMKGVASGANSEQAVAFALQSRAVLERNPTHGLVLMSGTMLANNVAPELHTFLELTAPEKLAAIGVMRFDPFLAQFTQVSSELEQKPNGTFKQIERADAWLNAPEMQKLMRQAFDIVQVDPNGDPTIPPPPGFIKLERPPHVGGKPRVVEVPEDAFMGRWLRWIAAKEKHIKELTKLNNGKPVPGQPIVPTLGMIGEYAGVDYRLVDATAGRQPGGKLATAAREVAAIHARTTNVGQIDGRTVSGVQLVFLDAQASMQNATIRGVAGFHTHRALIDELVLAGVPRGEIASLSLAETDQEKETIKARAKRGEIRVLLGSTALMGTGVNVQDYAVAVHHLDVQWRPAELEQRNGRVFRQGNLLYLAGLIEGVEELRYAKKGSLDSYKWSKVARKQRALTDTVTPTEQREIQDEDVDDPSAEAMRVIQSIASGNPFLLDMAKARQEVAIAERGLKRERDQRVQRAQRVAARESTIRILRERVTATRNDVARVPEKPSETPITVGKKTYQKPSEAKDTLGAMAAQMFGERAGASSAWIVWGEFRARFVRPAGERAVGVYLELSAKDSDAIVYESPSAITVGEAQSRDWVASARGLLLGLPDRLAKAEDMLRQQEADLETLRGTQEVGRSVQRLEEARERLKALEGELDAWQNAGGGDNSKSGTPEDPTRPPRTQGASLEAADDGDDGVRYGFMDPVSAALAMIGRALKRRYGGNARYQPIWKFSRADVEAAFQGARGLVPTTWWHRRRKDFERLRTSGNHFPSIKGSASVAHGWAQNVLLELEHYKATADAKAVHAIMEIVGDVGVNGVDLFNRVAILRDIQKDLEAGLYDTHPPPFRFGLDARGRYDVADAKAEVDAELADVTTEMAQHPDIDAAYQRRQQVTGDLTLELVRQGLLPESVLEDDRYYHRQVLAYMRDPDDRTGTGTGAVDARVKTKGFQRKRVGGGDFNTRYQEAEYEWMAQAHRLLHMTDTLAQIEARFDRQPELARLAKQSNLSLFYAKEAQARGVPVLMLKGKDDPLFKFKRNIALARQRLMELVLNDPAVAALLPPGVTVRAVAAQLAAGRKASSYAISGRQWFTFFDTIFAQLPNTEASKWAAVALKNMAAREDAIRTSLGGEFMTWRDLVPDDHVLWQPKEGTEFYRALTIEDRIITEVLAGTRDLDAKDVKQALVVGGRRQEWVIPSWLAPALDELQTPRVDDGPLGTGYRRAVRAMKWLFLQAPWRITKFIFNNLTGDVDAAVVAPSVFLEVPRAARDLWAFHWDRTMAPGLRAEMEEAGRLRVLDQGFSLAEIPDIAKLPQLQHIAAESQWNVMRWMALYPTIARDITQYRENIIRLAAWRRFQKQLAAGQDLGSMASVPARVAAARSHAERAAILANDLIGDYGNISRFGQEAKDTVIPFFSWMEINAKRYVNLFRNAAREGRGTRVGALAIGGASVRVAKLAVQVNAFLLLASLYNRWAWPEDDERLRRQMKGGYLILGHDAEGNTITVRAEGAFRDFLEWVGMGDYPNEIEQIAKGEATWRDTLEEAWHAPFNKIAQGWEPISKTIAEAATKRKFYPDVFTAHKRVARDRLQVLAHGFGAGWLYDRLPSVATQPLLGRPAFPSDPSKGMADLLINRSDPGADAWFYIRERAAKFLDANDRAQGGGAPTRRSTALYYYKRALRLGDEANAQEWLEQYAALGGTGKGLRASLRSQDPLASVPKNLRRAFVASLSPDELELMGDARLWASRTGPPVTEDARP